MPSGVSITDPGHSHTSGVVIRENSGTFGGAASGHGAGTATDAASANIGTSTTGITASVDIAQFNSGYSDPAITVSGGVTNHTGNSGNGGFANTALDVVNAHLAVNFQIKAH
jgi:hypothetical protein